MSNPPGSARLKHQRHVGAWYCIDDGECADKRNQGVYGNHGELLSGESIFPPSKWVFTAIFGAIITIDGGIR
jgi:hypothetical protein